MLNPSSKARLESVRQAVAIATTASAAVAEAAYRRTRNVVASRSVTSNMSASQAAGTTARTMAATAAIAAPAMTPDRGFMTSA